jgi:hypothetical protein
MTGWPRRGWNPAAWGLLALAAAAVLWYQVRLMLYPYVYEPNEWTQVHSAWLLLQGRNPWDFSEQPAACNVYGWVLPALGWLAAKLGLPLGLPLFRAFNAAGILGASALVALGARRQAAAWPLALWLALLFYTAELYYVGGHARVDGVALGFLALALWLPWRLGFSARGILAGLAVACLGAYVKSYLGLLPGFLALGAWRARGWKAGLATAGAGALGLGLSFWAVVQVLPTYGYYTVLLELHQSGGSWAHEGKQWILLLDRFYPALWAALALGWWWPGLRSRVAWDPFWNACLGLGLLLFTTVFGRGNGAFLSYALHWVAPFLCLAAAPPLAALPARAWLPLLALNFGVLAWTVADDPVLHPEPQVAVWQDEARLIAAYAPVWAVNECNPLLVSAGMPVQDGGQADALPQLLASPPWVWDRFVGMPVLRSAWEGMLRAEREGIERGDYRLVITRPPFEPLPALERNYRMVARAPFHGCGALGAFVDDLWLRRDVAQPAHGVDDVDRR